MDRDLTPAEIRVLGCLLEKQATTPDQYPLSINALVTAANQKSNRDPVMSLPEADVREAVTGLIRRGLVRQSSSYGGRVSRFEHRLAPGPGSPLHANERQRAVLAMLFLRGPQTPGELRARAQRMAAFDGIDAVEATLRSLAEVDGGPLVRQLERDPGKREARWSHGIGDGGAAPAAPAPVADEPAGEPCDLERRVARLERIVESLRARLDGD